MCKCYFSCYMLLIAFNINIHVITYVCILLTKFCHVRSEEAFINGLLSLGGDGGIAWPANVG